MNTMPRFSATLLLTGLIAALAGPAAASGPGQVELASAQARVVRVVVDDKGFTPSRIVSKAGESLTLVFRRTSTKGCATSVVFPELDIKRSLPLDQDVSVTVTPKKGKPLTFTCGMGMYRSSVVVE